MANVSFNDRSKRGDKSRIGPLVWVSEVVVERRGGGRTGMRRRDIDLLPPWGSQSRVCYDVVKDWTLTSRQRT